MGFMDFLGSIGSGISKAAGFISKNLSPILSMIPTPLTQGIAAAANLISGNTGQQAQQPAGGAPEPAPGAAATQPTPGGGAAAAPQPQAAPVM
jgi:hypothetical protein